MNNYYNSGLYMESFFTQNKHVVNDMFCNTNDTLLEDLTINIELLAKYYEEEIIDEEQDELQDAIFSCFVDSISYWTIYFEPLIFDETIAIKCGLIPFTFRDKHYLALGGCGMNLSPKLDAYQALTDHSIDEKS